MMPQLRDLTIPQPSQSRSLFRVVISEPLNKRFSIRNCDFPCHHRCPDLTVSLEPNSIGLLNCPVGAIHIPHSLFLRKTVSSQESPEYGPT